ncbi:MAG TPA: EMC3/TMCO1 family protein [Candidatus Nanoarchaeia archaeon]|nr:EMC3/TMCO1 family protein [Candidatus Nanoarchaeia archaeon]
MGFIEWISNLFSPLFNLIFYPLVTFLSPRWALVSISLVLAFLTSMAQKYLTNQQEMKSLKDAQNKFREEMKQHRSDPAKFAEIQKQSMEKSLQYMRHSFKPLIFTMLPVIAMFGWLKVTFLPAGDIFHWGFTIWPWGPGIGWLWTYFLSQMIFTMVIRKLFKIH